MKKILFNSDVGEEAGFDKEIMPFISLCNVACGKHAGSEKVIRETIDEALKHDVKIGAHPSYPDSKNFGRVSMKISHQELEKTILAQIALVKLWTEKAGAKLNHVKPHGALYNDACKNNEIAETIIECVKSIDESLLIIAPYESKISYLSTNKLVVLYEVFADRNYNEDLTLVSRERENALLVDPQLVFEHVQKMIVENKVKINDRVKVPILFDTICVHGDNQNSFEILKYLVEKLSGDNLITE